MLNALKSHLLTALTENQLNQLFNQFGGLSTKPHDITDEVDNLLTYIITNYKTLDICDGLTGEVLQSYTLNGCSGSIYCWG